jgi:ribosomal protein L4
MADEKATAAINAPVVTQTKGDAGTIELPGVIFGEPLRRALLAEVVRMQMAGRRAGTASTKERGDVRGGGKKPWKQKGTGRARAGSTRSPIFTGGAIIFGPHPRDYTYGMPKQARRTAIRSVLAQKLRGASHDRRSHRVRRDQDQAFRVDAPDARDRRQRLVVIDDADPRSSSLVETFPTPCCAPPVSMCTTCCGTTTWC